MATRGPPPAGLPAKVVSVPPNQTLYVTNLPSAKIQKEDLRTALYMIFSTYGPVLDVVALKTMAMRGQAHIVYRDIQTATQAMRSLDGFEFFGRPMKIMYAKSKSNAIAKLDGTFKIPTSAAQVEVTDLQQSIFNAPVPGAAAPAAPHGLPSKPSGVDHAMADAAAPDNRGVKRPRDEKEEEEESDSDVAMEEDSDDE
ncbi:U2 small nuclear ribonucleoprotein B'-like protein [Cercophora newfieldiana]|uniref:U2 small nuclear ribonucleoprotein B'-like protein n=1 Tax=Cercophora newfieldiana TaxID=92897 RepID=A0AA40D1P4_9PEZI|nr:U2 small nuclear ribonucleoprotein B'-like protein [Cercophora newfieldiana]